MKLSLKLTAQSVDVALWATQPGRAKGIGTALPIGKRLQLYRPGGNKKRSAGSTLAAQAASL